MIMMKTMMTMMVNTRLMSSLWVFSVLMCVRPPPLPSPVVSLCQTWTA
jgi:hypothetical protein